MKTVVKILLGIAIIVLAYMTIMSIRVPIHFNSVRDARDRVIIAQLIDIRRAQLEFRDQHGRFVSTMDSLVDFVRYGTKNIILREGALTEWHLENGLTEAKAAAIVARGNMDEIKQNYLTGFRRDTTVVALIDDLFPTGRFTRANIDRLAIIPFSNNVQFDIAVDNEFRNALDIRIPLFEVRAPWRAYLHDLDRQLLINEEHFARELNRFPGLMVGDVSAPNNNAGNWE